MDLIVASRSTASTCFSATTTTRSTSCAGATRRSTAIGRTRRVPSAGGTTPSNRRTWSASSTATTAGGSRGWPASVRSAVGLVVAMRGPRQQRLSPWPTSWSGPSVSWSTSSRRSPSQNRAGVAPSASAPRRGPAVGRAGAPAASVAAVVRGAALIGLTLPLSWAERVLRQATSFTGNQNLERVLPSLIEPVRRSLRGALRSHTAARRSYELVELVTTNLFGIVVDGLLTRARRLRGHQPPRLSRVATRARHRTRGARVTDSPGYVRSRLRLRGRGSRPSTLQCRAGTGVGDQDAPRILGSAVLEDAGGHGRGDLRPPLRGPARPAGSSSASSTGSTH